MRKITTREIAVISMMAALAFVSVYLLRIPVMAVPPFLKYEPKDVVIVIGGFIYGPAVSALISVVVSLVEMVTISETGYFGLIMNVLSTCTFACTAALIYSRRRTLASAVIGLAAGIVVMAPVMLLWNYLIVPLYMPFVTRGDALGMLVPVFLPFNLLKGGLNTAITILLYKPLHAALKKSKLVPGHGGEKSSFKIYAGLAAVSVFVILTCVLLILAWRGDI